jgi:hypothetical protein
MKTDSESELWRRGEPDNPRVKGAVAMRRTFPCVYSMLFLLSAPAAGLSAELPPVRIAYFVPSDREPIRGYRERLDRVMTEVQRFYRDGMIAAGCGPKTFALERDGQGGLMVHAVQGAHPMSTYGRNASAAVRNEVRAGLARQEIDMDRNSWVIFQVLLRWDGDKATEIGPYVGGGSHLTGTAWVYDDERLDPQLLASKAAGGYYSRPCSIGDFNSHYIGGVAHELGHAFGLPHDCQTKQDRHRGLSLMGGGNHTYGQELRGDGAGTFLSSASATLLAFSRPFAGELPGAARKPDCRLSDFDAQVADARIVLTGSVAAKPPAFGIVAFNDWAKIPADYDAVSWTCKVAKDGRFRLDVGELQPGPSQLRLWICHTNGEASRFAFDYQVDAAGKPILDVFRYRLLLEEAVAAYRQRDRARVESLTGSLIQGFPDVQEVQKKAAHLKTLLDPGPQRPWSDIPATDGWIGISHALFRTAAVGWGRPQRDEVLSESPGECFLQVDGRVFERGLFAHAPAKHELALEGKGTRFRTDYGLQDGHDGSVVFVVRGDGRELFRSPLVKDHHLRKADVDVAGVQVLGLSVEDGGDGANSDWGVWISPQLKQLAENRDR